MAVQAVCYVDAWYHEYIIALPDVSGPGSANAQE
jgi:hypothetical protein